jgi:hypothetical protein
LDFSCFIQANWHKVLRFTTILAIAEHGARFTGKWVTLSAKMILYGPSAKNKPPDAFTIALALTSIVGI